MMWSLECLHWRNKQALVKWKHRRQRCTKSWATSYHGIATDMTLKMTVCEGVAVRLGHQLKK
jgi:hypothetical protein